MTNALTVDVEEYFHPSELPVSAEPDTWSSLPCRLPRQIDNILELLEQRGVKATFFVLGWVAERHPKVVQRIAGAGHEIGCHSYLHRLVCRMRPEEFRMDTRRAVEAIAAASGKRPLLYRAPSFSIRAGCEWALEILAECGFLYDSSIYPIVHDRGGIPGFDREPQCIRTPSGPIYEIPIATAKLSGSAVAPIGGGGYLRLLPYSYTAAGIRRMNERDFLPSCIYFHPWELDPGVPRMTTAFVASRRTYFGIGGMAAKLRRLLNDFEFSCIGLVYPLPAVFQAAGTSVPARRSDFNLSESLGGHL